MAPPQPNIRSEAVECGRDVEGCEITAARCSSRRRPIRNCHKYHLCTHSSHGYRWHMLLSNTRHATHASCHRNQTHDQHKEAEPVSSAILVHQPRRQVGHELNNGGEPSHKAHTERERCPCAPHQVNLSNQHNTSVSRLKAPPKHHKCTCTQLT